MVLADDETCGKRYSSIRAASGKNLQNMMLSEEKVLSALRVSIMMLKPTPSACWTKSGHIDDVTFIVYRLPTDIIR